MQDYNPLLGVPHGHYYLTRVIQFGDFEVEHKEEILFTSESEQELIDMCIEKKWHNNKYNPHKESWLIYGILKHESRY